MATRRKNEWLDDDADSNGDEDTGYDSELADSRGKSLASRGSKRRKVERSDSEQDSDEADEEEARFEDAKEILEEQGVLREIPASPQPSESMLPDDEDSPTATKPKSDFSKRLAKSLAKTSKTGVIYISRIPPFMKPHTLKHFLEPYAPSGIGRLFLTPETSETHKSRVRSGGNKKRNFSDGWVEFTSKKEAKIAVETLNTRIIGGKKGGYYHDDVWNLKYLKGFKWRHLTEQIANENAERASRLRAEGQRERREVREYLKNVEQAKMLDGMEKKKRKKIESAGGLVAGGESVAKKSTLKDGQRPEQRQFRQIEVLSKSKMGKGSVQPDEVKRVLSKIF
jgi:ESF2/ABP1 family protein